MKRLLILAILCSLSFTGLTAQIRYCMSYADYQEGKWTELDTLKLNIHEYCYLSFTHLWACT